MKYFVRNGTFITRVRDSKIERYLKIGCKKRSPLNTKTLVDYSVEGNYIAQMKLYLPDTDHFLDENRKEIVFDFKPGLRPRVTDFNEMLLPVDEYQTWENENIEARYITDCINDLEHASILHGKRLMQVAHGFIANPNPFLHESGSQITIARTKLKEAIKNT